MTNFVTGPLLSEGFDGDHAGNDLMSAQSTARPFKVFGLDIILSLLLCIETAPRPHITLSIQNGEGIKFLVLWHVRSFIEVQREAASSEWVDLPGAGSGLVGSILPMALRSWSCRENGQKTLFRPRPEVPWSHPLVPSLLVAIRPYPVLYCDAFSASVLFPNSRWMVAALIGFRRLSCSSLFICSMASARLTASSAQMA